VKPAADAPEKLHSVDAFLGGLVTLVQPVDGHRAGLDAALLQALVPAGVSGRAVDLGAGVGAVAFCAAARAPGLTVVAVEREPALVAYGRKALQLSQNGHFAKRIAFVETDVRAARDVVGDAADFVLMNPPFDDPHGMQPSPDASRRSAHVATEGLLEAWVSTASRLVKGGGWLGLIHRPEGLPEILNALGGSFGAIRIHPVHPSREKPAIRILVQARRGSRGALKLMPGLILHQEEGAWTPEADAILRGRTALATE
jgi:tRNA1(Val) A37 N6-methylase TrmN6